jgi:hypothetical protein
MSNCRHSSSVSQMRAELEELRAASCPSSGSPGWGVDQMVVDGRAASDSNTKADYQGAGFAAEARSAESGGGSSCSRGNSGSSNGSCNSMVDYPSQSLGGLRATAGPVDRSGGLRRGLHVNTNFDAMLKFGGSSGGAASEGTLHSSWGSLSIPQTPSTPSGNTKGRR